MELTSKNVESIFMDCLFREGEDTTDPAIAEGITSKFGFHKGRLESHRDNISDMLSQLPKEFQKDGGGGMTFLNACNNAKGEQWTGLHSIMEELFSLGQACGKAKCLMPRDMWSVLPGGMPYYAVV